MHMEIKQNVISLAKNPLELKELNYFCQACPPNRLFKSCWRHFNISVQVHVEDSKNVLERQLKKQETKVILVLFTSETSDNIRLLYVCRNRSLPSCYTSS